MLCIAEPLDVLARELGAVAERITVILPWGSLLRAVAAPELESLRQIAGLCLSNANVEIVFSYDLHDAREGAPLETGVFDEAHITGTLPRHYAQAGLQIVTVEQIPQRELTTYETTWAKRLAFGRPRKVWRIRATKM